MIIGYLRISTNDQTILQQRTKIEEYANIHNLKIDTFISDEGVSAYRKDFKARNGFMELLHLVEKGNVTDIIVFETSRLSRRYGESINILEDFTVKGIRVHSVVDNAIVNQNDIDRLMNAFRSYMNQQSSKLTSERIKAKLSVMKNQGLYTGGKVLWGHHIVDNKVVPDENIIDTVISFFNDYISHGASYCMEKYGITNPMTINKRIRNISYASIVGDELFNHANKVRESRKCKTNYTTKTNRSKWLFEGLLFHSCGKKLYLSVQNKGKYYRCYNCKSTDRKTFKAEELENIIQSEIVKVFDNLSYDRLKGHCLLQIEKLSLVLNLEIKTIKTEIEQVEKSISSAKKKLSKFILEDDTDIIIKQISELIEDKTNELDNLTNQLDEFEKRQTNIDNKIEMQMQKIENLLDAKSIYNNANLEKKKAILQLIVKEIVVKSYDDIDIFLNI